ncbi:MULTISPECIES: hypothetical protein [Hyphomonas]|mgnify:CR=1 FL=1|uniref:Pentapeptide MXKDX repeat protein n=1 Tax=Hyphomonas adhaerens TaxID=81029 RepID=A0A3B9H207_9PROT|nr:MULTISPECIES: hypothetical protein [Hyphomonas]MBB38506.1 hypothetical protein [Hyphomonas sp.]HAE28732.1 hypothetical protein [Hyphomonas adhaerens]|tara:strand:- start:498 stop:938 length:441 start_codon:yes stop_codon:yes gene_type:complete
MKPVWIAAAMLALSPVALAQGGHDSHDHGDKPAAESGAAGNMSCMDGHEGMANCNTSMEGHMMAPGGGDAPDGLGDKGGMMPGQDGMMMDHDGMKMGGDGMMMDHDAMKMDQMNAGDCNARHEEKGHDPADYCPKAADQESADGTE